MNRAPLETTVGQWVAEHPQLSRLFESLRIDYCCGGGISLKDACRGRNLDPQHVLTQIEAAIATRSAEDAADWSHAPLALLCDHIERTHHAYLKTELPRLTEMVAKVAAVHGEGHPELNQVKQAFAELRAELEPHMFKEERILFPAIRTLEHSESPPAFPFGAVANPIRMMELEHDHAGDALERIRTLTANYRFPEGVCNTYRAMLDGLRQLEQDMHLHVHKENNILFPRAMELESSLAQV
jgi:regulator of cell morphogenesis and NO signaling